MKGGYVSRTGSATVDHQLSAERPCIKSDLEQPVSMLLRKLKGAATQQDELEAELRP